MIEAEISYYSKCNRPSETITMPLKSVLDLIVGDNFKTQIDKIREIANKDERSKYKRENLPAVTFGGKFKYRSKDKLLKASGIACPDIDIYDGSAEKIKEEIIKDKRVLFCFDSPSGGLKIGVKIPIVKTAEEYEIAFLQVCEYFKKYSPKTDEATKDVSRLCFLSYDPNIYVNYAAEEFIIDFEKKEELTQTTQQPEKIQENITPTEIPDWCPVIDGHACKKEFPSDGKYTRHAYLDGNVWQYTKDKPELLKAYMKAQGRENSAFNAAHKWEFSCGTIIKYLNGNKRNKNVAEALNACKSCPNRVKPTEKSFVLIGKNVYEQIKGGKFIDCNGKTHYTLTKDEEKICPNMGEELEEERQIVLLSDGIEDYGNVTGLIEDIKKHIRTYYDCDEQTILFSSWYVLLTWVYDLLSTINYLRALGDFGTGKSRFSDVVGRICYKTIIGSGAGSVAALKRMVKKWKGTVLTDEGDFKQDDEKGELVKFYNLGFEKNRAIYQCNKNDPNKIEFYDPFCPKIILTRRPFNDSALESRCLTHVTKVTSRKDIPILLPSKFFKEEMSLRNKLLKFRFDYYHKIDCDKILDVDLGDLEPRLKQGMISFTVLFANIPEVLGKFKIFLGEYQKEIIEDRAGSFDGQIVSEVINFILDGHKYITAKMIVDILPQGKYKNTPATIGKRLKSLGITTKPIKIDGATKRAILFDDLFENVVKRYCSDAEKVTAVTAVTAVTESCSDVQNVLNNNNNKNIHLPVTPVTAVTPVTTEIEEIEDIIHQICTSCGAIESHYWDLSKPICRDCYKARKVNK